MPDVFTEGNQGDETVAREFVTKSAALKIREGSVKGRLVAEYI